MTKVAYVTAGTVGAGHFVRGAAIARAFARISAKIDYRIFGPKIDFPCVRSYPYFELALDPQQLMHPENAQKSALANALEEFKPDLLLVDLFWAPLRYILPLPKTEAWLLLRKVPAEWLKGPAKAPFDREQYRRLIAIEPIAVEATTSTTTIDPIVIANPDEARTTPQLEIKIAVLHAGDRGEIETFPERANAKIFDLRDPTAPFPLVTALDRAELIISAAGYNSYWESRWFRRDAKTRFIPLKRRIDDQFWRVKTCASYEMRKNGADTLVEMILSRSRG